MEQFKIDVSKCTDDEKWKIVDRLREIGYGGEVESDDILSDYWDTVYATPDGKIHADRKDKSKIVYWRGSAFPERQASDFLTRFQTRPHDYTGCHPDIATALKRGEEIYCEVWDVPENKCKQWVYGYRKEKKYAYDTRNNILTYATPIPAEPVKLRQVYTIALTDEQLAKIKEMIDE